jgi:hypothetical protein
VGGKEEERAWRGAAAIVSERWSRGTYTGTSWGGATCEQIREGIRTSRILARVRSPLDGRCEATAVASTSADTTIAKATALSAVVSYHCASSYLL